jgi:dsRNA-specific ribonuclease
MIKLERAHLGYVFRDKKKSQLIVAMSEGEKNLEFQRLEFLGDSVIEVMTIYTARKILLKLKKESKPEILHSIKVVVLSNEGLARMFVFHKLHRFLRYDTFSPSQIKDISTYIQSLDFDQPFKDLWWTTDIPAPKIIGDSMEALCGALFLDGGWEAMFNFFTRISEPLIFFACKYFAEIEGDLIHNIKAYFDRESTDCLKLREELRLRDHKGQERRIRDQADGGRQGEAASSGPDQGHQQKEGRS